jgi:signal transduction histidine kinase
LLFEEAMFVQDGLKQKLSDLFISQEALTLSDREWDETTSLTDTLYSHEVADESTFLRRNTSNSSGKIVKAKLKAQQEWFGAIAALEKLLLSTTKPLSTQPSSLQGFILSAPIPVISRVELLSRFETGIFMPQTLKIPALMPCQSSSEKNSDITNTIAELPLLASDPLAREQFCLALTPHFGLLMVLGTDEKGLPAFHFSFAPETVRQAWSVLRSRLLLSKHEKLEQFELNFEQFQPLSPDFRLVSEFSRLLLKHLPTLPNLETKKTRFVETVGEGKTKMFPFAERNAIERAHSGDIELLQALTHEIRTPLTTIRTMTRLLLKRASQLLPEMVKRLETIDRECTEQINRMELIFHAAEFKNTPVGKNPVRLVPISLEQIFQQSLPLWQKQAQRRSVDLDVLLPQKLPQVVSDPGMLERVLTGLMEKFIRSMPTGGEIRVRVTTAGDRLKLQFYSQSAYQDKALRAVGQLLMFQPETGSLSLNMDVTKNLFNALGGKLIVRQKPEQGEVLTIFLPLGSDRAKSRV